MWDGITKGIGFVLLFAVGVYFAGATLPDMGLALPILVLLGLLGTILIHELGHAAAALLVRWQVIVFAVNRLAWHLHNRQFAILPRGYIEEAGGWVLSVPSSSATDTRLRYALVIAGGPAFSLIQALAAGFVAYLVEPGKRIWLIRADLCWAGFALCGLWAFWSTIVPRVKKAGSDGSKLLRLYRQARRDEPPEPLRWPLGLLRRQVRLRDIPEWMMEAARAPSQTDQVRARGIAALEIGQALDRDPVDVALTRSLIDAFWKEFEADDWLRACDAYLAAVYERDEERANSMIAELGNRTKIPQMEGAARAAVCMLAGDEQAACGWLDYMDAAIRANSPFRDLTARDIRTQIEAVRPSG